MDDEAGTKPPQASPQRERNLYDDSRFDQSNRDLRRHCVSDLQLSDCRPNCAHWISESAVAFLRTEDPRESPPEIGIEGGSFRDGIGRQPKRDSAADRGRLRASGARPGAVTLVAVTKSQPPEVVGRGGQAGLEPVRRKQSAGGQSQDSFVPGPFAVAHDRPFAIEQMPRRGGAVRDGAKRGQPAPGRRNQQARGTGGEDAAGPAGSQRRRGSEQVRVPPRPIAGGP